MERRNGRCHPDVLAEQTLVKDFPRRNDVTGQSVLIEILDVRHIQQLLALLSLGIDDAGIGRGIGEDLPITEVNKLREVYPQMITVGVLVQATEQFAQRFAVHYLHPLVGKNIR